MPVALQQPLVLVCAADNNYAMPLAVTIRSAIANFRSDCPVALYILDGGISQTNKRKITRSLDSKQVEINWTRLDDTLFTNLPLYSHLTISSYYRLCIPEVVPKHFDKAIYLDSDLVVIGDLEQLWNIDIGDNYVLAVQDDHQLYMSLAHSWKTYQELGISPDAKYFNSGVLVIDLKKWRSENIGIKVLEYIKRGNLLNDQDGLNLVLAGKWGELHPQWNQMPRIYDYPSWQESPFTEEVYNELLHQPYIVHYTTIPKPWYAGLRHESTHPKKDLFFQYLDMTAWAGWRDTLIRRVSRKFLKFALVNKSKL
ncbi:glycosyltransferase family 8 protein [Nostoc sp. MS1]|uniref:glycosyltransferase family 8 protein n=1 Tax=Nostoc sp. MS1 TaxID=2764711 RepID=UPI001CC64D20|nr:glycosyltransferase family 8 protein [Nostoc sp. MS1]